MIKLSSVAETSLNPLRYSNIKTVFIANLILGLINGFYNVILQPYIVQFIKSEKKLGLILTISSMIQSSSLILTAKVSDKRGRRVTYLSSIFLFILAFALFSQSKNLFIVISALLLFSFAFGIREPAIQALTAESSEEKKKTSSFTFVNLAFYSTGLVGPLIIRIFSQKVDLRIYFYLLFGGFVLLYIYQLFFLRESLLIENIKWSLKKDFIQSIISIPIIIKTFFTSFIRLVSIPFYLIRKKVLKGKKVNSNFLKEVEKEVELYNSIFKIPGLKYALSFFIFDSFLWGLSISIFNGSAILVYSFTEGDIAEFTLFFNFSTIVVFMIFVSFADKVKNNEILVMSEVTGSLFITLNIIAFFTTPTFRKYAIWIAWIGLGASVAFWVPGIQSIMTGFDTKRRAEAYGTVSGLQSLGWLPTSLIAGLIIEKTSFLIPFLITLSFLPIDIYFAYKFPEREKDKSSKA
ncbi:MAG: MFS transporter [Candidatus Heimdallarchaeaceae archaeon]